MFAYGLGSNRRRVGVNEHLLNIFDEVLLRHDHSITCGPRQPDEQQRLYTTGASQVPGREPNGEVHEFPHMPREDGAWAMDVWPYVDNKAIQVEDYDAIISAIYAGEGKKFLVHSIGQYCQFAFFAGIVFEVAGDYFSNTPEADFRLVWGGNWDEDASILIDQGFDDFPHWQLVPGRDSK